MARTLSTADDRPGSWVTTTPWSIPRTTMAVLAMCSVVLVSSWIRPCAAQAGAGPVDVSGPHVTGLLDQDKDQSRSGADEVRGNGWSESAQTPLRARPMASPASGAPTTTRQLPTGAWGRLLSGEMKWVVSGGLALAAAWLALHRFPSKRRLAGTLSEDVLEWLGSVQLDPRTQLTLVRLGSQVILLSQGDGPIQTLAVVADPQEVGALLASCRGGTSRAPTDWQSRSHHLAHQVRGHLNRAA